MKYFFFFILSLYFINKIQGAIYEKVLSLNPVIQSIDSCYDMVSQNSITVCGIESQHDWCISPNSEQSTVEVTFFDPIGPQSKVVGITTQFNNSITDCFTSFEVLLNNNYLYTFYAGEDIDGIATACTSSENANIHCGLFTIGSNSTANFTKSYFINETNNVTFPYQLDSNCDLSFFCVDQVILDIFYSPVCNPDCLNGGDCVSYNQCSCAGTGYNGTYCENPICSGCQNGGFCILPEICNCTNTGYNGTNCENAICSGCQNGGFCVLPEICNCTNTGYNGTHCENPICSGCQNGGFCILPEICNCTNTGYSGTNCENPICYCLHNSSCVAPNICDCSYTGYNGPNCSIPICDYTCQNGGFCIAPSECSCTEGFYGQACELKNISALDQILSDNNIVYPFIALIALAIVLCFIAIIFKITRRPNPTPNIQMNTLVSPPISISTPQSRTSAPSSRISSPVTKISPEKNDSSSSSSSSSSYV